MIEFRKVLILLSIGALVAAFSGCGGGGGGTTLTDTTAPSITNADADAPDTYAGGSVTFSATVTDAGGVKSVTAIVTDPNGSKSSLLSLQGEDSKYTGTYTGAKENDLPYAVTYTIELTAKDNAGNTATETIAFEVPGDTPPIPPK